MRENKIYPPTYFIACLLSAIILNILLPIKRILYAPYSYIGVVLIGGGIGLNLWADILFKKNKTTVKPFEKSNAFIEEGPFRFSRHPMYLGMALVLLGVAIGLGSITPFISPISFFISMELLFIPDEEKSLEKTFAQKFLNYRQKVRKWI